jgi:hypothetical protein
MIKLKLFLSCGHFLEKTRITKMIGVVYFFVFHMKFMRDNFVVYHQISGVVVTLQIAL